MTDTPPSPEPSSDELAQYKVEVPTVKSLFVEVCRGDLVISTGTAVLVAADHQSQCILVTNRHIVTGYHQEDGSCLHRFGALPDNICVYFHANNEDFGEWQRVSLPLYENDETPRWIEHPTLGASADIVALELPPLNDVRRLPYYLKTDLDRVNMVVSPAEPISVIGFPFGLSSRKRFPLWATGFLAQEMSLVTSRDPVFFIDCRTRQGQSGSAVIAYRSSGYRSIQDGRIVSSLSAKPAWEFLGIYSGRVNSESDLGKVWHVRAVEELYRSATVEIGNRRATR